jgi:TonB family protein
MARRRSGIAIAHALVIGRLTIPGVAEDRDWEQANSLLVTASGLEAFKPDQHPKFHLRADFVFHRTSEGKLKGVYYRDFVLPERWSDELVVADFRQSRVRIDKKIWTRKTADFVPVQVDTLFRALFTTTFQMVQSDIVDRIHNRKVEGIDARCIEFHNVVGRSTTPGEICVDRAGGQVVYWKYGNREIWYSQYSPFGSAVRPMRFVVAEDGGTSVEADISYSESSELGPDTFVPLQDAEVSDVCTTSRAPIAKDAPDPMFPSILSRRQFPKGVVIKAEIDENGHVTKEAVVESVHPILDGLALNAVKRWVFEPKLCDGKPVSTSTRLNVHFR